MPSLKYMIGIISIIAAGLALMIFIPLLLDHYTAYKKQIWNTLYNPQHKELI